MANCITTIKAREKMVKARAGDIVLAKITHMVFGRGGVNPLGEPIQPSSNDSKLREEIGRKRVDGHEYISNLICRYRCTLTKEEFAGESISEIGLVDDDGDLVAIKTFTVKGKDPDMEMIFEIDDEF